jgi:hypothetical protein
MTRLRKHGPIAALAVSVLALLCSLVGFAPAAGLIITSSKQIRPGVIVSSDIHNGGVRSTDVRNGTVQSADIGTGQVQTADIGEGQVQPQDVTAPEPEEVVQPPAPADEVGTTYALVANVTTYTKEDPTSILEVTWTGSAAAGFSGCVFQLRVDGQPSGQAGGGEVFVSSGSMVSVSDSASFDGLGAGPHTVQVYARATIESNVLFPCTVGPQGASIDQTFIVAEQVV